MQKIELAGCVLLDDYGRLLLLHRSADESSRWELPGGKVELGETAEETAIREANEELGVNIRLIGMLGIGEFEQDEREYRYTWFQAVIESGEVSVREPEKFDDLEYYEVEDLLSLALSENMKVLFEQIFSGEVSFIV